ncbi:hypothetical protein A3Q56_04904 [Intoshia linei]|uniref:R3H domain-containing protein n=1 Tax=Intoshia linei TaxID=1819745 RepID=A0A177AZF3_9BILA|nr:hypothetical protein A3Q56_04904 [Intoshia linei]
MNHFKNDIEMEINCFLENAPCSSILIFQPLSPANRFYVHKIISTIQNLESKSIGFGNDRRAIVIKRYLCHDELGKNYLDQEKIQTNIYQRDFDSNNYDNISDAKTYESVRKFTQYLYPDYINPEYFLEIYNEFQQFSFYRTKLDLKKYEDITVQHATCTINPYDRLIEIYDFPKSFVSQDILSQFEDFKEKNVYVRWVDDNHAIGIFSAVIYAKKAVQIEYDKMKVRMLSKGTYESQKRASDLSLVKSLPNKERPKTNTLLIRSIIGQKIGNKNFRKTKGYQKDLEDYNNYRKN